MLNELQSAHAGVPQTAIATRLVSIFARVFRVSKDRIRPDIGPADIERWDSVGHVMLVTAIEREFSLLFEVDEIMEFSTFQAILSAVEGRTAA